MIAEGLALLLALAPGGAPRRAPPARRAALAHLSPQNAERAKRGLLPRKIVLLARGGRAKRALYRPGAPSWVPEPTGPGPEIVLAEADAESTPGPVAYPEFAAVIHGVEIRWMVIRHRVPPAAEQEP